MRHKWNESDLEILEENIKSLGFTKGCKKTSEQLGVSDKSCRSMYSAKRFKKYTRHAIPVTHPEKLKNISIVENKNTKNNKRWTAEEFEFLKMNIERYGFTNGCRIASERLFRSFRACQNKAIYERTNGNLEYMTRRWSDEKKKEVLEFIKERMPKNPNNISKVFRDASDELGVSYTTLKNLWYARKESQINRNNIGPLFTLVGATATVNGKNQEKPEVKKTKWIFTIFKKWFNKKKK